MKKTSRRKGAKRHAVRLNDIGYWKRSLNEAGHEERRTKLRVAGGGEARRKGRVARELARK